MNAERYVKAIARKIKCNGEKKKEIKKQLLMDIHLRLKQGERLEDIISQMGTVKEIAEGFNENIPLEEQKRYVRNQVLKIVIPIVVILVLLIVFVFWMLPKSFDIEQSKYFSKEQVEAAMKETVALLDAEDYAALQEGAIPQMESILNAETMNDAKKLLSDDWGERKQFGAVYMVELVQGSRHYAVGEIVVTYENVSATYRLTYNEDMCLTGIYVR
ncbi:DUF3887 domain-containing protein [Parablautia muri]|uniref:DUF3887 domain-containing protein n=1 Tax=Parablautia muri TaxID=2320879 RepID=A0A9X5BHM7_9FIRM|nr:DUF3887 domain-containing protein [Parablautia muri]NBJ93797.1 DUF3887 domain-containing protein [Parablautia muri]